ncbi:ABC-2 transporter permease [Staphylococcus xylosus]|uniref:ABC-2 transporter permease n=1 Tax=Staphylococcus xylosus TaxID=1288 RepID=UPI0016434881|nr:ABC-2 transporter permease [Staphylococcus xylosus]MCD8851406.1 ABC-2 transporter permease [Staphylococcus xylosus]MEB7507212.1 ABC-2 transporter permease [Staphylococcus xylosus]MEB8059656.1 ABC-2 transporter permease [Staphylococcus xylosus]
MRGLLINQYYTNKQTIIKYVIWAIAAGAIFSYMNLLFSIYLMIIAITTPAIDNLKKDENSGWDRFISTLPLSRNTYVLSSYSFYFMLTIIGLLASTLITFINTLDLTISLNAIFISLSVAFQYSLIFTLTYKLGTDKSNMIQIIASLIIPFSLAILYSILEIFNYNFSNQPLLTILNNPLIAFIYFIFSSIILAFSIILSLKTFNKKEF